MRGHVSKIQKTGQWWWREHHETKTCCACRNPSCNDLRTLIEEARSAVSVTVNSAMTMLYWRIGKRINDEILHGERAEYGKQIVSTLSRQLAADYGDSFTKKICAA